MMLKINFRKKIFIAQGILLILLVGASFILTERTATHVIFNLLKRNSDQLVPALKKESEKSNMVSLLENIDNIILYGVSLFDSSGQVLFDSTLGPFKPENYLPFYPNLRIDISPTSHQKTVSFIETSQVTHEQLLYLMIPFQAHGEKYILRTSFAHSQVDALARDFDQWYLVFCILVFVFFGLFTWGFFHRINYPIQQIIKAIKPYQTGLSDTVSQITLSQSIDPEDNFYKLAQTLNSLSERLRIHIQTLTDERNEKEAVLESLGEGVVAIDEHLSIRYINFIGSKMLGIPKRHLIGKPFLTPSDQRLSPLFEKCHHLLQTCLETQAIITDSVCFGESKKIYIDLIAAPTTQHNGAILVLQDKSSHYRVLEMGKDFVANASHELRTPITIIKGFAETLQDLPEIPHEMLVDITEKIVRNCQRMDNLVKNLLTLADIENLSDSRFQECDLRLLIENCCGVVLAVYHDAQINIEKSNDLATVFADSDILELAIINLLDNACKYSPPPAQITISIQQIDDEASIIISDKGIGIPQHELDHIFDRFYTVNKAHSRRLGGAGLGLSIVKTIIDKHDGTITVTSQLGIGTTFTVKLPSHKFSTE